MNKYVEAILNKNGIRQISLDENSIEDIRYIDNCKKWASMFMDMLHSNKKINIFTDYDCDGVCATGVLYHSLRILGVPDSRINIIIPSREYGYGLTDQYYDQLIPNSYLLTADNGINELPIFNEINKRFNIKVIACDHHEHDKFLSKEDEHIDNEDEVVVVDPYVNHSGRQIFEDISGSAFAWKLILIYCSAMHLSNEKEEIYNSLIDLVGISTISDVMPMKKENRFYIKKAIETINSSNCPTRWKYYVRDNGKITNRGIGFGLAPLINSDSRMNMAAKNAIKLVTSCDENEIKEITRILEKNNSNRKDIVNSLINDKSLLNTTGVINVIKGNNDEKERDLQPFCGLISSRFVEKTHLPSITLVERDNEYNGSARTYGKFDLIKSLKTDRLKQLGFEINGHSGAAGVTIHVKDNLEQIIYEINQIVNSQSDYVFQDNINRDDYFDANLINMGDIESIESAKLSENGIPSPKFKLNNVSLNNATFLKGGLHLKKQYTNDSCELIQIIYWNWKDLQDEKQYNLSSNRFNLYGRISINEFRGNRTLQFVIDKLELVS